jgi:unsaturated rhamnogalacturonyl hydrolase
MNARAMAVALILPAALAAAGQPRTTSELSPLDVARILAARYPEDASSVRYIPALAWSGALRLSALTGEARWAQKARREMQPFVSGEKGALAPPFALANLAGYLAFSDLAAEGAPSSSMVDAGAERARKAAELILPPSPEEIVRLSRWWTDDMFMATSLMARVAARTGDGRYAPVIGRLLVSYAGKLQRPDGLFVHAVEGPHAWGRGNGFAALGMVEALTYLPESWPDRAAVLDLYRRQMRALVAHQTDDGAWRQVVDEPTAYEELTVTAMTVAAMARGVRRGWLDRAMVPSIDRGWSAVLVRVSRDATLRDVCASTGAGPTKAYYLTRPAISGADDRGGAVVLLAALEVHELRATR